MAGETKVMSGWPETSSAYQGTAHDGDEDRINHSWGQTNGWNTIDRSVGSTIAIED